MAEADTRKRKSVVFLLILLSHGLIIESLLRTSKESEVFKAAVSRTLFVYFLPPTLAPVSRTSKPDSPSAAPHRNPVLDTKPSLRSAPAVPMAPSNAPAAVPPIDWQAELEFAVGNSAAEADKSNAYRDLSKSISRDQLDWLRDHHMEPANPGITWKKPRVEVTGNGLPIIHINDHCVLVPMYLIPMVFCSIGHIEPSGDLFKYMREQPLH